jgi:hypothetical protein
MRLVERRPILMGLVTRETYINEVSGKETCVNGLVTKETYVKEVSGKETCINGTVDKRRPT